MRLCHVRHHEGFKCALLTTNRGRGVVERTRGILEVAIDPCMIGAGVGSPPISHLRESNA
jgi:hypothetical protein